jgi:hypothetical protein
MVVFENLSFRELGYSLPPKVAPQCLKACDPLPAALGLGLGLGHPWATQAWPKGHASATQGRSKGRLAQPLLFATKDEKWGRGVGKERKDVSRGQQIRRSGDSER